MKVHKNSVSKIVSEYLKTKVFPQYKIVSNFKEGGCIGLMIFLTNRIQNYIDNNSMLKIMYPDDLIDVDELMYVAKSTLQYLDNNKLIIPVINFGITDLELQDMYEIAKKYAVSENTQNTSNTPVNNQVGSSLTINK